MTRYFLILFFLLLAFSFSCNVIHDGDEMYVPRDVIVKTDSTYSIGEVFNFINSFDFKVEDISSTIFYSTLPADSVKYVEEYLSQIDYVGNPGRPVNAHVHYLLNQIYVCPYLRDMHKVSNQINWLNTMKTLQFHEKPGYVIHFKVPRRQEKQWERRFQEYSFVEWAELNYYMEITY